MKRFFSRGQARLVAITVALVAMLSFAASAGAGVAHADAQANQTWISPSGAYLGWTSGEWYYGHIHSNNAPSQCLDVPGNKFYDAFWVGQAGYTTENGYDPSGAQVQVWDCEPNDVQHDYDRNQLWQQVDNGDGSWSFYVQHAKGNFCLDSLGGHHYDSSPVEVYPCNYGSSQRWTIGPSGQLQSVDSPGYCLDDTNWDPYGQLQLWHCAY